MSFIELIDVVWCGAGNRGEAGESTSCAPSALASYLEKVLVGAYQVTDEDLAALRAAGYSESEIFEATVHTALGAGLFRLGPVDSSFGGR
jgi:hypothetical protein